MNIFPEHILNDDITVLDLFCAAFYGDHTIQYLQNYKVKYVGMDNDKDKLMTMAGLYPDYDFFEVDIYDWLPFIKEKYYLVISDQWTNQNEKIIPLIGSLCDLSTDYVLISTNIEYMPQMPLVVNGFELEIFQRRNEYLGGTYWAVYHKI